MKKFIDVVKLIKLTLINTTQMNKLQLNQFMKLLFTMLSIAFFQLNSRAQTNDKYIEVCLADSIEINPDIIVYQLNLNDPNKTIDYGYNIDSEENTTDLPVVNPEEAKRKEEEKFKLKMKEKQIVDLLNKEKIPFTRKQNETSPIYFPTGKNNKGSDIKGFSIRFKSYQQMNDFLDKIPEEISTEGKVMEIAHSRYEELENQVTESALNQAKQKAERIAKMSNVKLGQLMQFSDNEGGDLVKAMERLMYNLPRIYQKSGLLNNEQKIIIIKTVRVRFAIE